MLTIKKLLKPLIRFITTPSLTSIRCHLDLENLWRISWDLIFEVQLQIIRLLVRAWVRCCLSKSSFQILLATSPLHQLNYWIPFLRIDFSKHNPHPHPFSLQSSGVLYCLPKYGQFLYPGIWSPQPPGTKTTYHCTLLCALERSKAEGPG